MSNKNSIVLLGTSQVTVFTKQGKTIRARICLYNGSQSSFVKRLDLKLYKETLNISGISENITMSTETVNIKIHQYKINTLYCYVLYWIN